MGVFVRTRLGAGCNDGGWQGAEIHAPYHDQSSLLDSRLVETPRDASNEGPLGFFGQARPRVVMAGQLHTSAAPDLRCFASHAARLPSPSHATPHLTRLSCSLGFPLEYSLPRPVAHSNMSLDRIPTKESSTAVKKESSIPSSVANERIETASITSSVQHRYESTIASQ